MMKQNNPLRRLLAALLAALTLVSFTILPVLGAAEDEAADTEAAETTVAPAEDHGKDDDSPPAVTTPEAAVVTVSAVGIAAQRIASRKIVIHCIYSFISYYIGAVRSPDVSKERFLSRPEN